MLEIRPEFARVDWVPLLLSCVVDTNEWLRQRALRLVTLGFSQKVLAAKMDMAPSTFSKWLNQKDEIGPASVTALDGFNAYVQELVHAVSEAATTTAPAGSTTTPEMSPDEVRQARKLPQTRTHAKRAHSEAAEKRGRRSKGRL